MKRLLLSTISAFALLATPALAQMPAPPDGKKGLSSAYTGKTYSPYAGRTFPSRPLWGDTQTQLYQRFLGRVFHNRHDDATADLMLGQKQV